MRNVRNVTAPKRKKLTSIRQKGKQMADYLAGSIKNLNTLLGEQLLDGSGSGGGGSSDFSTAKVTFSGVNGTGLASMPKIINTPFDAIVPLQNEVTDETYTIALYKGKGVIGLYFIGVEEKVTTSGAIELIDDSKFPIYLVTGDGTITIA